MAHPTLQNLYQQSNGKEKNPTADETVSRFMRWNRFDQLGFNLSIGIHSVKLAGKYFYELIFIFSYFDFPQSVDEHFLCVCDSKRAFEANRKCFHYFAASRTSDFLSIFREISLGSFRKQHNQGSCKVFDYHWQDYE